MHELTIASELLHQTLSAVRSHADQLSGQAGDPCIEEVEVEIGLLRLVVPEALEMAWQVVCEGTAAEGARLSISETRPAARCRLCGRAFEPTIDDYLCPGCKKADVEICGGNDIVLRAVTYRGDEG